MPAPLRVLRLTMCNPKVPHEVDGTKSKPEEKFTGSPGSIKHDDNLINRDTAHSAGSDKQEVTSTGVAQATIRENSVAAKDKTNGMVAVEKHESSSGGAKHEEKVIGPSGATKQEEKVTSGTGTTKQDEKAAAGAHAHASAKEATAPLLRVLKETVAVHGHRISELSHMKADEKDVVTRFEQCVAGLAEQAQKTEDALQVLPWSTVFSSKHFYNP